MGKDCSNYNRGRIEDGGLGMLEWGEWLKRVKNPLDVSKKSQLLLILLVGLLLVVIAIPTKKTESERDSEEIVDTETAVAASDITKYSAYLEEKIANALEHVSGVGKTEIVITFSSNGQKIVEKDQQSDSQKTTESDSVGGTRDSEDRSSERTSIYIQEADGTQTPYISEELLPEIQGVLVIAEGGDNAVVVKNITEAIQALFGLEAHKIKIMKRTET